MWRLICNPSGYHSLPCSHDARCDFQFPVDKQVVELQPFNLYPALHEKSTVSFGCKPPVMESSGYFLELDLDRLLKNKKYRPVSQN